MNDDFSDPIPDVSQDALVGDPEKLEILIVDYDPEWPRRFELEQAKITAALGERACAVDHIGSTAVPGLASKPIIDICLTVADSSDEASYVPDLVAAGYELRVREPDFHEHRMLRTPAHNVHVHVFTVGSLEISRYLILRDWLRIDDADRALYASTKRALARQDWPTMQHYAEAKSEVVESILSRASGANSLP
jgi:GrpB-like predicted nucleotidyltransferase (UPF0157 family)